MAILHIESGAKLLKVPREQKKPPFSWGGLLFYNDIDNKD